MEELIFFAVIIFFSILESIARSRKAKQQGQQGPTTAEPEQFEWAQTPPWEREPQEPEFEARPREREPISWDDDLPTYDEELSYDERAAREEAPTREEARPASSDTAADIWAEITGLAAGKTQTRTSRLPVPDYAPPRPASPAPRVPAQRPRETRVAVPSPRPKVVDEHEIHLAHVGYGTDPSERAPSEQDLLYALRERLGPDAAAARALLRGSTSTLRQAVILHEVLGPPASMRDP